MVVGEGKCHGGRWGGDAMSVGEAEYHGTGGDDPIMVMPARVASGVSPESSQNVLTDR